MRRLPVYGVHMATNNTIRNTTAENIRHAIMAADRSHRWVADRSGIAMSTLRRKLAGGADFGVLEVVRIANALNVHPADLLPAEFKAAA